MGERDEATAIQKVKRSSPLAAIVRGAGVVDTWMNYFGMVFTVLLMLMTVLQVTGRRLFNHPFSGYIDSEEMMMALLVFLSLAYCQWQGGHIRFDLFMTGVLKGGRAYHVTETVYLLMALLGFGMIAIYSVQSSIHAYVTKDVTLGTHWPIWPAMLGSAIGSVFLCIRFVIQIIQNLSRVVTGEMVSKEMWREE